LSTSYLRIRSERKIYHLFLCLTFPGLLAGKDVWVTISGHLGSKDGYATFDPTEFKVGDMNVPVSLVNPTLQKKLAEQHDQLKLPDYVGDVRVQNGELVMQQK